MDRLDSSSRRIRMLAALQLIRCRPVFVQVWSGHALESEHVILDPAVAVQYFQSGGQARLAVAAGQHLYIYNGVKIHYKLTLPSEPVHPDDQAAWYAAIKCAVSRREHGNMGNVILHMHTHMLMRTPERLTCVHSRCHYQRHCVPTCLLARVLTGISCQWLPVIQHGLRRPASLSQRIADHQA
jgi:hypothetical protein